VILQQPSVDVDGYTRHNNLPCSDLDLTAGPSLDIVFAADSVGLTFGLDSC